MNGIKYYIGLFLKGIGMGAADVVPGVSGGTIAFLSGIYTELIFSIKSLDINAVTLFFKGRFKDFWKHINGNFLASVGVGILTSIFTLAHLMVFLMENYPIPLWSFFFGLIIASSIIIISGIKKWSISVFLSLLAGVACGAFICLASPSETPDGLWYIFIAGAIAICAMILPGISGSFILLLIGKYEYILTALNDLKIQVIMAFAAGATIGIISFSHLLSWLLKKYNELIISLLSGFMIGSLIKIWPWQEVLESGVSRPQPPGANLLESIVFFVIGLGIILIMDFLSKNKSK